MSPGLDSTSNGDNDEGSPRAAAPGSAGSKGAAGKSRGGAPRVGIRALMALAAPAMLSYLLNNTYRINDQFWIQGLGPEAQAAAAASMFVLIMNFAVIFLALGGTLALVARFVGAQNPEERDRVIRHALGLGLFLGVLLTALGVFGVPHFVPWLGIEGAVAGHAEDYLGTLFACMTVMVLVPVVDSALIGMGNTLAPMLLQLLAISLNFVLNPLLIYGGGAVDQVHVPWVGPIAGLASGLADSVGLEEGFGMRGAALATAVSRLVAGVLGVFVLARAHLVSILPRGRFDASLLRTMMGISLPSSLSIAFYAGVYWAMLNLVISRLGDPVYAGLGIGFQVFEGLSFPMYMGIGMAAASLVGRSLGAGRVDLAWTAVRNARTCALIAGGAMTAIFLGAGPPLARIFTSDPAVWSETVLYVTVLAYSQPFVALESVHDKVLSGAGHTRPSFLVATVGNLIRIPLSFALALTLGWGAIGVWWAINLTTYLKAGLLTWVVHTGTWSRRELGRGSPPATQPPNPSGPGGATDSSKSVSDPAA